MIKNEMESIKTLFINGKEKNEVKVPKFVNEKFTSLPILLRPINNWEGTNVMYTRLGRPSDCRNWTNDAEVDMNEGVTDCPIFTQVWLNPVDAEFWSGQSPPTVPRKKGGIEKEELQKVIGLGIFSYNSCGPIINKQANIHGGAIATLIDTFMGNVNNLNGTGGPTAYLNVKYIKPIPINAPGRVIFLKGSIDKIEKGKNTYKVFTRVEIYDKDKDGELYAVGDGLFIHKPDVDYVKNRETMISEELRKDKKYKVSLDHKLIQQKYIKTKLAKSMLTQSLGHTPWILDNARGIPPNFNEAYHNLNVKYLFDTKRIYRDFLWNSSEKRFIVVTAFSRLCQGPPMSVHGGCLFAVLDDAITRFIYARAATDFDVPPGLCLTGEFRVDYKMMVPLDDEYVIETKIISRRVDKKGRVRVTIEAALKDDIDDEAVRTVCRGEFVATGRFWAGQSVPSMKQKL